MIVGRPPPSSSSSLNRGEDSRSDPTSPARRVPVVDRSKVRPEVVKAAEGMEAMFLDTMMKAMRRTVPKSEMSLQSPATEIYQGMLDTEYAEKAAHHPGAAGTSGVGLADQIIAYLQSVEYNYERTGHKKEAP